MIIEKTEIKNSFQVMVSRLQHCVMRWQDTNILDNLDAYIIRVKMLAAKSSEKLVSYMSQPRRPQLESMLLQKSEISQELPSLLQTYNNFN
jgi:hypothetical protein